MRHDKGKRDKNGHSGIRTRYGKPIRSRRRKHRRSCQKDGHVEEWVVRSFQSKENLQIEILDYAARIFSEDVIIPALATEAGIPRIKALVNNWIEWSDNLTGGCIFVTASTDYSDRPGKVRNCLLGQQGDWIACLCRIAESAIKVGDFREGIECEQFAFDLYSLLLGFHLYDKLLDDSETKKRQEIALERLLANYKFQNQRTRLLGAQNPGVR